MGTPEFAVPSLDALIKNHFNITGVVTGPDKPAGRGQKLIFSPVKKYALKKGLQLLQPEKLKDPVFLESLRTLKPDLQVVVAFRIPNLLRDLVGEGASNAAFVPVLSEYVAKEKKEEFWVLARTIFLGLLILLSCFTLLGIIYSSFIVRIIAPGFVKDPDKFHLTILLTRRIFPYIFLIGLAAFSTGVLNSLKHFLSKS